MKIHTEIEQGSVDWLILRSGKVTASEMDALISPLGEPRKGEGVKTYMIQKLCEAWIGGPLPSLQGVFDMEQGKILEDFARPAFTLETGLAVTKCGFVTGHDERLGCSPDGMVGERAGLELKCPAMPNHVRYLLDGKLPKDYVAQVQGSMYVTGLNEWYFCSFRRNFPPLVLKVERDEEFQKNLVEAVDAFWVMFDKAMVRLIDINGGQPDPRTRGQVPFKMPTMENFDIYAGA